MGGRTRGMENVHSTGPAPPATWGQHFPVAITTECLRQHSCRAWDTRGGLLAALNIQAILGHCITQASRLGSCPNSCIQQSSSPPQYSLWLSFHRTQVYGHQNETAHKAVCSRTSWSWSPTKEDFANRDLKVKPRPPQWFLWVPVYPGKARGLKAWFQGRPRYVSCFQFCRHRDVMRQARMCYRCSY